MHMNMRLVLIRNHCCIRLNKLQFGIEDRFALNVFLPYQVEKEHSLGLYQKTFYLFETHV